MGRAFLCGGTCLTCLGSRVPSVDQSPNTSLIHKQHSRTISLSRAHYNRRVSGGKKKKHQISTRKNFSPSTKYYIITNKNNNNNIIFQAAFYYINIREYPSLSPIDCICAKAYGLTNVNLISIVICASAGGHTSSMALDHQLPCRVNVYLVFAARARFKSP